MSGEEDRSGGSESIGVQPQKLREAGFRALLVRFAFGFATSVAAGGVTLALGPRVGGLFLAFPAILAASLTLVEKEEDAAKAREEARGAVLGALALLAFAAVGVLLFARLPGAAVLALALVVWLVVAFAAYALDRRRR